MVFFSLLPYTTIFDAIRSNVQNALFRYVTHPECAFP